MKKDYQETSRFIDDSRAYPLKEFMKQTGLGEAAMRSARRHGLKVCTVGRNRYVRGADFIEYLEKQAEKGNV
jgi:hypothetical protein